MIDLIEELERRLNEMIESLHAKSSVNPWEGREVTHPEAKKNIQWYLYSFLGAVMGARLHLARVQEDATYTAADRCVVRSRIWDRLEPEFVILEEDIKNYRECQERELMAVYAIEAKPSSDEATKQPAPAQGDRQRILTETLAQLRLLEQEIYELRLDLPRCIAPTPTPGFWP
jgi:hypothetical protein